MRGLLTIVGKDLRLLWRDRAGLVFLSVAPIVVITVAGFSLSSLYGTGSTGQTAYELPVADEDGGKIAAEIRDRLGREPAVEVRLVPTRAAAKDLVVNKQTGSALVIPKGIEDALRAGEPAALILYVDAAKYLERLNVHVRLLELRDTLRREQRARLIDEANDAHARLTQALEQLRSALPAARQQLEITWARARRAREDSIAKIHEAVTHAQHEAEADIRRESAAATDQMQAAVQRQLKEWQASLRGYLDLLTARRQAFEQWLAELKRQAGKHAADIPPPPVFPEIPETLRRLAEDSDLAAMRLPAAGPVPARLPAVRLPELPPLPTPPALDFPKIELPEAPRVPGPLGIEEINVSGGPDTVNTFDQNVPGFSVTFLLLGMLLGVSLGLLDERDWGTLDRVRAMPVAAATVLIGKLLSRFFVGFVQMVALLAVGRVAFGISLGPQPWALLLPAAGIVFAGTAFGVVVAGAATSREAVLPVGSIVIVTMAAVGGCWWPIDLEPRWMRSVALAFPTTWAMDAFNDLMIRRRTAGVALFPTAVMLGYGCAYLAIGLALFRYQLRRRNQ